MEIRTDKVISHLKFRECFAGYICQGVEDDFKKTCVKIGIPNRICGKPVVGIEANAFEGIPIISITIPNTVEIIGFEAFVNCKSLRKVYMSKSVEEIGRRCFAGCKDLTIVFTDNKITEFPKHVFEGCKSYQLVRACYEDMISEV